MVVTPGSSATRRLVRAVVANIGPNSAQGLNVLEYVHSLSMLSARALSSGWSCSPYEAGDICTSPNTLRSGATVTFEIEIELRPDYTARDPRPMIAIDSATLDLNPANNRRWFDLI